MAPDPFSRVGIVGLGLMGGSLARSLKALPDPPMIRGLTLLDEERDGAMREGVIDEGPIDPRNFFPGLDLVVYGTPLRATLELLDHHRPLLDPSTVITDLASLKAPVLERARALGLEGRYVGSHPMAGSEASGFMASRQGLYEGRRIWLVAEKAALALVGRIKGLWKSVGGECVVTDPWDHDRQMAWVSHLPQVASTALARVLARAGFARDQLGPGGMDMTRLAASNPSMWGDLLRHAPDTLGEALAKTGAAIETMRKLIEEGRMDEVEELMRDTGAWSEGNPWR